MKIRFDKKQLKLFWYWINERHKIYLRRQAKDPWPWTKDKILQTYKFTNAYRQLDRVTQAWTQRFIHLLCRGKKMSDGDLLFHCAMFRLFNWPETYDALYYGFAKSWNLKKAIAILQTRQREGKQIFTGAYIIPNAGRKDPKIQVICEALDFLYDGRTEDEKKWNQVKARRDVIAKKIRKERSMEKCVKLLQQVPTIGPFIAYEIACDLRHTRLLADARDVMSWANPGPGAQRGIHRLATGSRKWPKGTKRPGYVKWMRALYRRSKKIEDQSFMECEWPFEMREIEHSLCEFDKMMRVRNGEGRPRSKYRYEEVPWHE